MIITYKFVITKLELKKCIFFLDFYKKFLLIMAAKNSLQARMGKL